jgi:hypothetical protein
MKVVIGGLGSRNGFFEPFLVEHISERVMLSAVAESADLSDYYFLSFDFQLADLKKARRLGIPPDRSILVQQEPTSVWPLNYKSSTLGEFASVIPLGRHDFNGVLVSWPVDLDLDLTNFEQSPRSKLAHMVCANKLSLSKHEHYSLRKAVAKNNPKVDLFGGGWEMTLPGKLKKAVGETVIQLGARKMPRMTPLVAWFASDPSSLGSPHDKIEVSAGYKVAVAIENSSEYVSEKLFDALLAGCITVYVGPSLKSYGIDEDFIIQSEPDEECIRQAIERANSMEELDVRRNIYLWLSDSAVRSKWHKENAWRAASNMALEQLALYAQS